MIRRLIAIGAALAVSGPFCFDRIVETDIGWHLALGRWISSHGIPFRNELSWTAPEEPWYATSWLYDWIVARATLAFGVLGLQSTTFAFLALALVGIALACERADRRIGIWVTPIAALLLLPRIFERPHVATWAVIAWVAFLCVPDEETRKLRGAARDEATWRRRLWCLPIIAIGSNLHSGAAFAAIVLGFFCLEAFWLGARRKRELLLAAAGGAALLANPGGIFNVAYVVQHLHVKEVIALQEFMHPNFTRHRPFFILVPIVLLIAWRFRREWPALLAVMASFAVLGYQAIRVTYEFALLSSIALAAGLGWIRERVGRRADVLALLAGLALLVYWQRGYLTSIEPAAEFDRRLLPVRAAEFIRAEKLDGRMYNGFRDGGYLEWALPDLRWFQDARVQAWPPEFFQRQIDVEKSPEAFRAFLREWDVEWAVATRVNETLAGFRKLDSAEWALVYWDDATEVFIRRDVERLAPWVARLEYRHFRPYGRVIGDIPNASRRELMEWMSEVDRFQQTTPDLPEAWLVRCAVTTRLGSDSSSVCGLAEQLADSERGRRLVASARSMSVAIE